MSQDSNDSRIYSIIEARIHSLIEEMRPPKHIRPKLDITYTFDKNVLELYEERPHYLDNEDKITTPVAKARYFIKSNEWRLYRMNGNLKWERYETKEAIQSIDEVFNIIKENPNGCFFG